MLNLRGSIPSTAMTTEHATVAEEEYL